MSDDRKPKCIGCGLEANESGYCDVCEARDYEQSKSDLVSFGNFLGVEVTHADLENWKNEKR